MAGFALNRYASLRLTGPDAGSFLQGQVSADVAGLGPAQGCLAGWHDAKGRVLALLNVIPAENGFTVVLPAELAESTAARMRMFVLRARVTLEPGPPVAGSFDGPAGDEPWQISADDAGHLVRLPGSPRWLRVGPGATDTEQSAEAELAWEFAAVKAGLPEVYAATSGRFVAQMLNLDTLGGISFTKGCYPGQEVIARAHHLGRIKRRMRRFRCPGEPPGPGEALGDGVSGTVVRSAPSGGDCELLAVVPTDTEGPFALPDGRTLAPAEEAA
ncbi:MAG: hypothetical protein P8102_06025 [Gammaproteobacteria bacterium]